MRGDQVNTVQVGKKIVIDNKALNMNLRQEAETNKWKLGSLKQINKQTKKSKTINVLVKESQRKMC